MNRLEEMLNEFQLLGIQNQLDYEKFYLYSLITHSTAIEGSTITEIENRLLFDEGIGPGKPVMEQMMNLDLKAAYEAAFRMARAHEEITADSLISLSGVVMKNTGSSYNNIAGTFDSSKGELRLLNVSAGHGGRSYIAWQKVPNKLQQFCDWVNQRRKKLSEYNASQIYKFSFEAHYHLVSIHPWADGNGRMARLVMNMLQFEAGVPLSVVRKESRNEYIESLARSQEQGDPEPFIGFMIEHHIDNLEKQAQEYRVSLESDTIKANHDTLFDTLNRPNRLSSAEKSVFSVIKENREVSIDEITQITSLSRATVNRAIRSLKEKNLLRRNGSKKTGRWEI